jgi:taurine dioxygenase
MITVLGGGMSFLGCEINDMNLKFVTDADINRIRNLILKHKVVKFKNQDMTEKQQVDVCRRFGEIIPHPLKESLTPNKEVTIVTNINSDGHISNYPGPPYLLWHSDGCYLSFPPLFSFFYAEHVPTSGGDTLFIDAQSAYNDLPDEFRLHTEWVAEFDYSVGLSQRCRKNNFTYEIKAHNRKSYTHPVFRKHPVTGDVSIFANSTHTSRIYGMNPDRSDFTLQYLFAHCEKNKYISSISYDKNDLVIWDNSATIHSGNYLAEVKGLRRMRRVMVLGY